MQVNHQFFWIAATTIFLIQAGKADEYQVIVNETRVYEESYDGHWYKFYYGSGEMVDWVSALKRCGAIGYHVVDLEDENEISFVNDFVNRSGSRPHGIWTSATYILHEKDFIWPNGKIVDKILWDAGEPNNAGGSEHCVALIDKGNMYRLNDISCTEKWAYICEH